MFRIPPRRFFGNVGSFPGFQGVPCRGKSRAHQNDQCCGRLPVRLPLGGRAFGLLYAPAVLQWACCSGNGAGLGGTATGSRRVGISAVSPRADVPRVLASGVGTTFGGGSAGADRIAPKGRAERRFVDDYSVRQTGPFCRKGLFLAVSPANFLLFTWPPAHKSLSARGTHRPIW